MKGGDLGVARTGVGLQIVERDETLAYRAALVGIVDAGIGVPDLAVCGRAPSAGVETAALITAKFAEVSCTFQGTRHSGASGYGAAGTGSFVVEEEECPVLLNRPANGAAEVVPAHGSEFDAGLVIEEVIGVELVVAQEIISAAMELVRTRAGDNVNHRSAAKADLGAEV